MAERDRRAEGFPAIQVAAEHRQLDTLFAAARAALDGDEEGAALETLGRLQSRLEAHFEQEDSLYYPTLWTLRPDQKAALLEFVGAHGYFRARLRELLERVQEGSASEAQSLLEEIAGRFAHHEAGEEGVLQLLEREAKTSSP
jgi:hypothetical protein